MWIQGQLPFGESHEKSRPSESKYPFKAALWENYEIFVERMNENISFREKYDPYVLIFFNNQRDNLYQAWYRMMQIIDTDSAQFASTAYGKSYTQIIKRRLVTVQGVSSSDFTERELDTIVQMYLELYRTFRTSVFDQYNTTFGKEVSVVEISENLTKISTSNNVENIGLQ